MKKEKGSVYIQEISYPKKKEAKLKIELIRFLGQPNQKCSNLIIPNEALRVLNNYCRTFVSFHMMEFVNME